MRLGIIIVLITLLDLAVAAAAVWGAIEFGWNSLAKKYPKVDPLPDAVTRKFQSFRINWMNFGWCVHVSADENYLHMTPGKFLRIFGARTISIPWPSITIHKQSRNGKRMTVKVDEQYTINGPAWCLSLADPTAAE